MKIKTLLICFLLFVSTAEMSPAQQNSTPAPLKFDEFELPERYYNFSPGDGTAVEKRAERFARELKKRSGVNGFIIFYQAQIADGRARAVVQTETDNIKRKIRSVFGVTDEKVVSIEGGFRENGGFEFWIAPEGAPPPAPTPTFTESEAFVCPDVYIYSESLLPATGAVGFTIPEYKRREIAGRKLTWKVSEGEIDEHDAQIGSIRVKLKDNSPRKVTAFLEVHDLPLPCQKIFTATAAVGGNLLFFDSFGDIKSGDLKARLDALLNELSRNPSALGYIINYADRSGYGASRVLRERLIKRHMFFRRFDAARIVMIDGGYRETDSSDIYVAYAPGEKPVPKPSVDASFTAAGRKAPKPRRKPAK